MNHFESKKLYKLAPYVGASKFGEKGIFGLGSHQKILDDLTFWFALVALSSVWKKPMTSSHALDLCIERYGLDSTVVSKALKYLHDGHFVIEAGLIEPEDRYSRNHFYYHYNGANPQKVQEKLANARVAIVGCGGIGNHVSAILSTSGVGTIDLVDDDHIELSNLTRQVLFDELSIGQKKTAVLAEQLRARNSEINIITTNMAVRSEKDIEHITKPDLFVLSADSPSDIIDWFNVFCVKHKVSYINVGYINDISVIGPFYIPEVSACFRCSQVAPEITNTGDEISELLKNINSGYRAATYPAVNGVSASMASNDILKYLGGFGEILSLNKRIGVYSSEIKIETQDMIINPLCNVCGTK